MKYSSRSYQKILLRNYEPKILVPVIDTTNLHEKGSHFDPLFRISVHGRTNLILTQTFGEEGVEILDYKLTKINSITDEDLKMSLDLNLFWQDEKFRPKSKLYLTYSKPMTREEYNASVREEIREDKNYKEMKEHEMLKELNTLFDGKENKAALLKMCALQSEDILAEISTYLKKPISMEVPNYLSIFIGEYFMHRSITNAVINKLIDTGCIHVTGNPDSKYYRFYLEKYGNIKLFTNMKNLNKIYANAVASSETALTMLVSRDRIGDWLKLFQRVTSLDKTCDEFSMISFLKTEFSSIVNFFELPKYMHLTYQPRGDLVSPDEFFKLI